jgi:hypothetical protein
MNFFDKLSYGLYWFHVCLKEWYDAVIIGYYDEHEQPSWDFFCHINCNYPLTYRMTMGESKMTNNDRTMPNPIQLTRMIFDYWLIWFYRVKSSFEVMDIPSNYDHSESNIPPYIDCRFGFISSDSGGIGNFRWINSNPSNCFNLQGRIIWAGRWSLYVDSGRLTAIAPR